MSYLCGSINIEVGGFGQHSAEEGDVGGFAYGLVFPGFVSRSVGVEESEEFLVSKVQAD